MLVSPCVIYSCVSICTLIHVHWTLRVPTFSHIFDMVGSRPQRRIGPHKGNYSRFINATSVPIGYCAKDKPIEKTNSNISRADVNYGDDLTHMVPESIQTTVSSLWDALLGRATLNEWVKVKFICPYFALWVELYNNQQYSQHTIVVKQKLKDYLVFYNIKVTWVNID